jgi:hypothetical protein
MCWDRGSGGSLPVLLLEDAKHFPTWGGCFRVLGNHVQSYLISLEEATKYPLAC